MPPTRGWRRSRAQHLAGVEVVLELALQSLQPCLVGRPGESRQRLLAAADRAVKVRRHSARVPSPSGWSATARVVTRSRGVTTTNSMMPCSGSYRLTVHTLSAPCGSSVTKMQPSSATPLSLCTIVASQVSIQSRSRTGQSSGKTRSGGAGRCIVVWLMLRLAVSMSFSLQQPSEGSLDREAVDRSSPWSSAFGERRPSRQ